MKNLIFLIILLTTTFVWGRSEKTLLDQHYGPDERQIFDLWLPKSHKRTPLVIYIHGGGFVMGSKDEIRKNRIIKKYLEAGIAFAAINYRFLKTTPLQTIMREDIAGFVQFMRYHSRKFNINKNYILSHGFSAGGSSSLWLGTHDDIADENHENPIKRESSRVLAIGHLSAQVSYDFIDWFNYFGREQTERFVGQQIWSRYHFSHFDELFTEKGKAIRQDVDNYENMDGDDAPMILWNGLADIESPDGNHFMHSPRHAKLLAERAQDVGLEVKLLLDADREIKYDILGEVFNFFTKKIEEKKKRRKNIFLWLR
jgi:hypothetical protein